jgi:TrmH family RNA methyltransferase
MISKNTIKLIKSLAHKKFRLQEKLFIVEGDKNVAEVLKSELKVEHLFATHDFLNENKSITDSAKTISEISKNEIIKASLLKSPQNSLALCNLPDELPLPTELNHLTLFLDGIQDPGNLGTIIRVCDWFGIKTLFCSADTVDFYNPKVIQASMGSFCRLQPQKKPFNEIVKLAKKSNLSVFGAYLNGENIYKQELPENALLVMGNEGNGIRVELEPSIDTKISVPQFTLETESLNVAMATAIICSEFRRNWL